MKKIGLIIAFIVLTITAYADVSVKLLTGQNITGEIVFQNEDVIILKNADGQRFQYPMSEVESINETEELSNNNVEQKEFNKQKKVGVVIDLSTGVSFVANRAIGGNFGINLFVGAPNLLDRNIFLGAGIGYNGDYLTLKEEIKTPVFDDGAYGDDDYTVEDTEQKWNINTKKTSANYSFIPLQLRISMPLMQGKHAPLLGASIGYGFCTSGINKSGLAASFDLGWRMQINTNNSFFAGLNMSLQQTKMEVYDTFTDGLIYDNFKSTQTRNICRVNLKVGIQF